MKRAFKILVFLTLLSLVFSAGVFFYIENGMPVSEAIGNVVSIENKVPHGEQSESEPKGYSLIDVAVAFLKFICAIICFSVFAFIYMPEKVKKIIEENKND